MEKKKDQMPECDCADFEDCPGCLGICDKSDIPHTEMSETGLSRGNCTNWRKLDKKDEPAKDLSELNLFTGLRSELNLFTGDARIMNKKDEPAVEEIVQKGLSEKGVCDKSATPHRAWADCINWRNSENGPFSENDPEVQIRLSDLDALVSDLVEKALQKRFEKGRSETFLENCKYCRIGIPHSSNVYKEYN